MPNSLKKSRRNSAANAHGAEAQNNMASRGGPAETQHRAEAREKKHLVQLVAKIDARRPGENLVVHHPAVGVNSDIHEQAVRQGEFQIVLLRGPRLRILRERDEFGRTQNIQRHIVGVGLHDDARHDQLQNEHENENRGEKSAGSGNRERTEYVIEKDLGAVTHAAPTAGEILSGFDLGGSDANADGKVRRRSKFWRVRQQNGQPAIAFQLSAAMGANFQMFANLDALFGARRLGDGLVEISRQPGTYSLALHWKSKTVRTRLATYLDEAI